MNRFVVDRFWSFLKGLTLVRAHVLMSGTTPILQKWTPPTLNSATAGAYVTAATTANPQGGIGTAALGAEGVKTVTRTATGLWTVVLQDQYSRLLHMEVMQSLAGGLATIGEAGNNTTITSLTSAGGSTIGVALLSSSATAADPGDTTQVDLTFILQNSSAL